MRRISEKNHDPSAKFDTILSKLKKALKKAIPKAKQKGIDEMDDLMPTTLMYVSLNVMHNILKNMAKDNNHPTEDFSQLMSASMIAEGVFDRIDTDTKIFIMEFIEEILEEASSRMNQIPSRAMDVDIDIDFIGSTVSESFRKMIREYKNESKDSEFKDFQITIMDGGETTDVFYVHRGTFTRSNNGRGYNRTITYKNIDGLLKTAIKLSTPESSILIRNADGKGTKYPLQDYSKKQIKVMISESVNEVYYPKAESEKAAKELLSTPVGKKYIPLVKQKEDALSAIDGVKKNDKKYADLKTALDKAEKAEKDYRIKHILSHPLLVNEPKKPAKTLQTTVYNQAKAISEGKDSDIDDFLWGSLGFFSKEQLDRLRKEYSKIKGIDPLKPTYKKIINLLDNTSKIGLKQLASANINFISSLAKNRINK